MYKKTINLDTKSNNLFNKSNKNEKKKSTPSRSKKSIKYDIDLDNQPSKNNLDQSIKFKVNDSKNSKPTLSKHNNSLKTTNNSIKIKKNIEKSPINNLSKHHQEKKKILQNKTSPSVSTSISDPKNTIAILKKESKDGRQAEMKNIQADDIALSNINKKSKDDRQAEMKKAKPKCSIDIPKISQKKKSLKTKSYSKKKSQVKSKNNISLSNTISNNFFNETEKKHQCKQQLIPKYFNNNLKTNNKITFRQIKDNEDDYNVKVRTNINYFTKKNIDNELIDINKAKDYLLKNNYIKNDNIPDNMVKDLFIMFSNI